MNLGYTGKPYDSATGLYNYGYRDYSPQAARFTTIDPVRDGNNWYAYVNNDPVNWIDLWGLEDVYAMRLVYLQGVTRTADMYQKGGGGRYPSNPHLTEESTFCNQATFDIAIDTGFNQDALFYSAEKNKKYGRDDVNANSAARNLAYAAEQGTIEKVSSGGRAQELADMGYTVIAAWENTKKDKKGNQLSGHLATVAPSSLPLVSSYSPATLSNGNSSNNNSPWISNVGANNGMKPANEAFGNSAQINYYYDPNQQFDKYDSSGVAQRQEPVPVKNNIKNK